MNRNISIILVVIVLILAGCAPKPEPEIVYVIVTPTLAPATATPTALPTHSTIEPADEPIVRSFDVSDKELGWETCEVAYCNLPVTRLEELSWAQYSLVDDVDWGKCYAMVYDTAQGGYTYLGGSYVEIIEVSGMPLAVILVRDEPDGYQYGGKVLAGASQQDWQYKCSTEEAAERLALRYFELLCKINLAAEFYDHKELAVPTEGKDVQHCS